MSQENGIGALAEERAVEVGLGQHESRLELDGHVDRLRGELVRLSLMAQPLGLPGLPVFSSAALLPRLAILVRFVEAGLSWFSSPALAFWVSLSPSGSPFSCGSLLLSPFPSPLPLPAPCPRKTGVGDQAARAPAASPLAVRLRSQARLAPRPRSSARGAAAGSGRGTRARSTARTDWTEALVGPAVPVLSRRFESAMTCRATAGKYRRAPRLGRCKSWLTLAIGLGTSLPPTWRTDSS